MAIKVWAGLPGSGKSLKLASIFLELVERNIKIYKKYKLKRVVYLNLKLKESVEKKYSGWFQYWSEPSELVKVRDGDVIFDEIATYLDSTQWANVPLEFKRWLQLHRHYGIDIYGVTQDFLMIDISMRRLVSKLYTCRKLTGSRDISTTRPPPKRIWGVILVNEVSESSFKLDSSEYRYNNIFPDFFFITKKLTETYDTQQELTVSSYPALKHIQRVCDTCGHIKVVHY